MFVANNLPRQRVGLKELASNAALDSVGLGDD